MTRRASSGSRCTRPSSPAPEVEAAVAGLPLKQVADDSVYEYESAHLPDGAWPPYRVVRQLGERSRRVRPRPRTLSHRHALAGLPEDHAGRPVTDVGVRGLFCGRPVAGDRALIMAIVNRTPDSFYDRGATFTDEAAKDAVHRVVAEGADVIDIGGVKAGPGATVDADEEIRRVVPFIEWLRAAYPRAVHQCRHLARVGGHPGVRRRGRPHQRHLGRRRPRPAGGRRRIRGRPGLLAHRRRCAHEPGRSG